MSTNFFFLLLLLVVLVFELGATLARQML
jgi:hypothetical protein